MIFYFSGTGNSYYAAKKLAKADETVVNIVDVPSDGPSSFHVAEGETVGFVFPVYFYTLSDVMIDFINRISLTGAGYVYAVITCGGSIGGAGGILKEKLAQRGITLHAVFPLLMPDNAMLYYNISTEQEARERLKGSKKELEKIKAAVDRHEFTSIKGSMFTPVLRWMYHRAKKTKKFYVTDSCISCGLCEKNCPDHAIRIKEGHPVWVHRTCIKCTSCINRCPVKAIQYTKRTEKRNRYVNPVIKREVL